MHRRGQMQMSDEELQAYLEEQRSLAVATIGLDGYPHVVAMWFAVVNGEIAFWTYAKAQKAVNLRRDPRLTCLIESGDEYAQLRGVMIKGHAELIEDAAAVLRLGETIHRRYAGGVLSAEAARKVAAQAPKRIGVIVRPEAIVSWDHRKLAPNA
ncbi:MAG: pyridoxamine 5'-phosphate oxidase family protein [Ktedonobacterales bacterium]